MRLEMTATATWKFSTEAMTYVYGPHPSRAAVYVLVESYPRRDDEPVSPNPFKDTGVWTTQPNGSSVWTPE
jgi:hypothetical protein